MTNEELLELSQEDLAKYCLALEKGVDEGWEELEREEDGYFQLGHKGSKGTIYYFQVEWERDGYTLSYQFNEHSDHDYFNPLNEIELDSLYLRKSTV